MTPVCFVVRRPRRVESFVTSIKATLRGGHYWVSVFLDHKCAGEIVVREEELPRLVEAFDLEPEQLHE